MAWTKGARVSPGPHPGACVHFAFAVDESFSVSKHTHLLIFAECNVLLWCITMHLHAGDRRRIKICFSHEIVCRGHFETILDIHLSNCISFIMDALSFCKTLIQCRSMEGLKNGDPASMRDHRKKQEMVILRDTTLPMDLLPGFVCQSMWERIQY